MTVLKARRILSIMFEGNHPDEINPDDCVQVRRGGSGWVAVMRNGDKFDLQTGEMVK